MSDAHLCRVLDDLPRLRPGRLQLSGRGEPLLHPLARHLLASARDRSIPVTIQTNGVGGLSAEELCRLGVDHLVVNLSAGTAAGYEAVHPGRGALFYQIVSRLKELALHREAGGPVRVTLLAVVTQQNLDELTDLVELAHHVGAQAVQLKGVELVADLRHEGLVLRHCDRPRLQKELARARARSVLRGVSFQTAHLDQLTRQMGPGGTFSRDLARGPCFMGWYYLRVTCDGRVMFCCKDKEMGRLDQWSIYELWRSPEYHLHRLAGRDGDPSTGLLDQKCRACSNVVQNRRLAGEAFPPPRR